MQTEARLSRIRAWMVREGVQALIVPSADPHQSEYPPDRFRCRAWLSGFEGSAGTLVVGADSAALWTDSRYFLEAERALEDSGIELMRSGLSDTPEMIAWTAKQVGAGGIVAVDAQVVTPAQQRRWSAELARGGAELRLTDDPFDEVWPERPAMPAQPVFRLDPEHAAAQPAERLARLREELGRAGARAAVVATLDDIAWLLTLRGSDVPYNPVFVAYLIVEPERVRLFSEVTRFDSGARELLDRCGVELERYDSFFDALAATEGPVLIDPDRSSAAIAAAAAAHPIEQTQPTSVMKARKNAAELANVRSAMQRDGAAMVRFLAWLDRSVARGESLDERTVAAELTRLRSHDPLYLSDSFESVSGFAANGAIVHYRAAAGRAAAIAPDGVFLIDSGAQYRDGTTDITRTVAIGSPPPESIEDATYVLKAHIALATVRFPAGTVGSQLDTIARGPLWRRLRSYGHGTGHGVGYVLNVHEGPQRLAPGARPVALESGMIVSCEPGLYRTDRWGVRLENLVVVREAGTNEFGVFLELETLSLCPFDLRLLDAALLSEEERAWLDEYHDRVRRELTPLLDELDAAWLAAATRPI